MPETPFVSSAPPCLRVENSIAPLDVWIAIKTVLRRELGEREWEMWIQHARLWRVMSGNTLGVLVPRKGKASFGSLRYIKRVRGLARKMGYAVVISVEYDMDYHQLKREAIEAIPVSDRSDEQLKEDRWEVVGRNKVPEHLRETDAAFKQAVTADELLSRFPVSHPHKAEMLEQWEKQNEWLSEPFLEPPCSPLWEGFHV